MSNLLAQDSINNPVIPGFAGKTQENTPAMLGNFISKLIGVLLVFATIFTLFQLLQGALEWISSGGDKTGLDNARNRITNALIGLVIVFAAWSLYLVILRFLGVSLIGDDGMIQLNLPSLTK